MAKSKKHGFMVKGVSEGKKGRKHAGRKRKGGKKGRK